MRGCSDGNIKGVCISTTATSAFPSSFMNTHIFATSSIVAELFESRIRTYLRFASSAVFIYDYLLTLGREIRYIWPAEWSIVKVLYILTRYLAFADVALALYYHLKPRLSVTDCKRLTMSSSWLLVLGIAVAEVILILRTWAVWNRGRFIGTFLIGFFVLSLIAACVLEGLFLGSLTFAPSPSDVVPGCILTGGNSARYSPV
ncbi:hypothetical protein BXZ70DRAFT_59617 [Cristinia sonorae]|uniref:DUF6533 domain-containing protein n=1 Tax=Cristinia sonorae TaxID=1940300 RepID=A0A8K0US53_9AGAR|nr:hypothetical protein BXZ70DRAFT_59617 [Cristinia sonorae]